MKARYNAYKRILIPLEENLTLEDGKILEVLLNNCQHEITTFNGTTNEGNFYYCLRCTEIINEKVKGERYEAFDFHPLQNDWLSKVKLYKLKK